MGVVWLRTLWRSTRCRPARDFRIGHCDIRQYSVLPILLRPELEYYSRRCLRFYCRRKRTFARTIPSGQSKLADVLNRVRGNSCRKSHQLRHNQQTATTLRRENPKQRRPMNPTRPSEGSICVLDDDHLRRLLCESVERTRRINLESMALAVHSTWSIR